MNQHLDERQLNDCADGALGAAESAAVAAHLLVCAGCREQLESVRGLKAQLAALPRDIAPPPSVLAGVHARIAGAHTGIATATAMTATATTSAAAALRAQATGARPGAGTAATWRVRPRLLAAAAVVLIAASSAITVLVMRPYREEGAPANTSAVIATDAVRLVGSTALEETYEHAIAELQAAFERQQGALAPDTRRILELNLAIIDRALAESRAALAADPANAALAEVLRSGYERKLDVLRSAAAHARARS